MRKIQQDYELQQAKIAAADKERYSEQIKADYIEKNATTPRQKEVVDPEADSLYPK
jgi:hypothetical protein